MARELDVRFNKAIEYIKEGYGKKQYPNKGDISNEHKLKFYGYYKVVHEGPNNTQKPGFFDFVGKSKWQAWKDVSELTADEAKYRYILLLDQLAPDWLRFYDLFNMPQ